MGIIRALRERQAMRALPHDLAPALQDEVDAEPWMYAWQLTPSTITPVIGENLPSVHRTREEMIAPIVSQALAAAGPGARALDLGCNEGFFSHRLLEWGAASVVGIDSREPNIRRATLLREHFHLHPEQLQFIEADVLELQPEVLGSFDVVLLLGLIYHLERPLDAIRLARRVTRTLCVIESQLTRQDEPIVRGDGIPGAYTETAASFAAWVEVDSDANRLSSLNGVMSLVPNRAALAAMPVWAGFEQVHFLPAAAEHDPQYVEGDRAVVTAWVGGNGGT